MRSTYASPRPAAAAMRNGIERVGDDRDALVIESRRRQRDASCAVLRRRSNAMQRRCRTGSRRPVNSAPQQIAWGTPRTRMGAPRERLMTPWSDWAAPGSAQELLGVLGAPTSAWQRLATLASGFCFAALTSAWSAWGRLAAGAPPGLRLGRACAAPGGHLGSASESLGSAWGAPGTPYARRRARGGMF